jgi:hypothetical protein
VAALLDWCKARRSDGAARAPEPTREIRDGAGVVTASGSRW